MWKEFKEFAFKGNVVDMAVGVIIGGAFGKIVSSLVGDIIMPFFAVITKGIQFTNLKLTLDPANPESAAIMYGNFIQNVVDFFIIAVSVFAMITVANKLMHKKKEEPAPEAPKGPTQEELLTEIRDLLKEKNN